MARSKKVFCSVYPTVANDLKWKFTPVQNRGSQKFWIVVLTMRSALNSCTALICLISSAAWGCRARFDGA